jgi:hypothetical protein
MTAPEYPLKKCFLFLIFGSHNVGLIQFYSFLMYSGCSNRGRAALLTVRM